METCDSGIVGNQLAGSPKHGIQDRYGHSFDVLFWITVDDDAQRLAQCLNLSPDLFNVAHDCVLPSPR